MSNEEKQSMMDNMMDKFFSNMSGEEKQSMMQNMMPKMMGSMMGGKGGMMGMMEMMGKMMSGNKSEDGTMEMPWDMCKKMMSGISKSSELATYATPEIRQLFEEWMVQIEEEILIHVKGSTSIDIGKIAEQFKLSKESVIFILTGLAKKGKINFKKEDA